MTEPCEAVRAQIAAALPAESVVCGDPNDPDLRPDVSDRSVWVLPTGGLPPIPEQGTGYSLEQHTVQVIVREAPGADFATLKALADSARGAINKNPAVDYIEMIPRGGVIGGKRDSHKRPTMSFNLICQIME